MSHGVCPFLASVFLLALLAPHSLEAQTYSSTVVWSEPGLPTADSASASPAQLAEIFQGAHFVSAEQLATALVDPQIRLLVLPQGSAIPEASFSAISDYLHHGGNLLVLGGRPFTRSAYRDGSGWHLRDYSVRFTRPLQIDQYQTTRDRRGQPSR